MVRPRWLSAQRVTASRLWCHWDRAVALWAGANLLLVLFDITYIPLRTFWLQRNLTPLPQVPLVVPLSLLPDLTPLYDPVKGIEPHRETQAYLQAFERLDQPLLEGSTLAQSAAQRRRLVALTEAMINENPFAASGNSGTLEKIKNRLRQRASNDSAKQAAAQLLGDPWLKQSSWQQERRFWQQQVLPLVATSYWRSIDENGRPTDHFWRIDLLLFQSVFALDILLRMVRMRRRFPGLSWRDALLRRWIDLPLLLPFWRWMRVVPVVERLSQAQLINVEPLRAAVSRAVVSLLALELFEVLALQLVDGTQSLIRSSQWPRWIRSLRSHQSAAAGSRSPLGADGAGSGHSPACARAAIAAGPCPAAAVAGGARRRDGASRREPAAGWWGGRQPAGSLAGHGPASSPQRRSPERAAATGHRSLLGGAGGGSGAGRHARAQPGVALRVIAAAQAQLPGPGEPGGH